MVGRRRTIGVGPSWSIAVKAQHVIGPSYAELRPVKRMIAGSASDSVRKSFPVYDDIVTLLRDRAGDTPNPTARHVCAVLSAWSYSDPETVSQMMARLGLFENHCRVIATSNSANFIRSTAFLVQSKCRKVLLLVYRGTDPFDVSTWATSAEVDPVMIPVAATGASDAGRISVMNALGEAVTHASRQEVARVHAGFYRNQRSTWFDVVHALQNAAEGKSIVADLSDDPEHARVPDGFREDDVVLYVTGHSLGGAMALLASYRIASDDSYSRLAGDDTRPPLREWLAGVYTFAQPMVGNRAFACLCADNELLSRRLYCHNFRKDIVPHIPPGGTSGEFAHTGKHYWAVQRSDEDPSTPEYEWSKEPGSVPERARSLVDMLEAGVAILVEQAPSARALLTGLYTMQALVENVARLRRDPVSGFAGIAADVFSGIAQSAWNKTREFVGGTATPVPVRSGTGEMGYSFWHHSPVHYVACSQPSGTLTELGDDF
jgi:hypothetical protein